MASSLADSCLIWDAHLHPMLVADSSAEHLRQVLDRTRCSKALEAGELVFMTDFTPHEVLLQHESTQRTFFRLVVGNLSVWESQTCSANPLGIQPDAEISHSNKFADVSQADTSLQTPENDPTHQQCANTLVAANSMLFTGFCLLYTSPSPRDRG